MKKLIFRKFLLDAFSNFLVLIFSFSLIVWVIQAVNYLDFISEDGHGFKVYFLYTLFNFPKIFSKLFLVSLFISLFYIIIKYENDNELSINWSVGISKINFINKVLKFSVLLLIFQIFLTSYISPKSQNMSKSFFKSQFFNKSEIYKDSDFEICFFNPLILNFSLTNKTRLDETFFELLLLL